MEPGNTSLVLAGFLIMLVCQDLVAVKAFKRSVREGLLCVMVPGYILLYASREGSRQTPPVIGWLGGFAVLVMGLLR